MKDNDLGRSPGGDGLSQAEPVSAVSALRASIPSAEAVAMWRCAMSTPVECVDRLRAKWAKRRNRSKVLQEFDGELDDLLQFLMDRRHKNAPDSYPAALAYHKALNMLVASGIEARSDETAQQAQPEGQEPGPKGDAQTPSHRR